MTKSKFAGLAEARMKELEGETTESETPAKPGKQKAVKKAVRRAGKPASQQTRKPASKKADTPELVSLTVKVPEENRIWWNFQARIQRTNLTDAVIEALTKRF